MKPMLTCLLFIAYLVSSAQPAQAEDSVGILNKLLAPGPLLKGHDHLESDGCFECHEMGSNKIDDKACLKCHTEIAKSIREAPSFHSLVKKPCYKCHSDHKGRTFDSTKINTKSFNHNLTGFALKGKHKSIECTECHTNKRTKRHIRKNDTSYLGLKNLCVDCHKKDDVHFFTGKFKQKQCSECHGFDSWKADVKFNHKIDANYELKGSHKKLECTKCHQIDKNKKTAKYNWPRLKQDKCLSCHQDQHRGKFSNKFAGGKCEQCHTNYSWKIRNFDHGITGFTLKGKHLGLDCQKCHVQKTRKELKDYHFAGLQKSCETCHQDKHGFGNHVSKRYGKIINCTHCHSQYSFDKNIDFNHNLDTRWKITGKHKNIDCEKCHVKIQKNNKTKNPLRKYHWANLNSKTCENCHKSPHKNSRSKKFREKKCSQCHTTEGWHIFRRADGTLFNHNTETRFDITGSHKKLACKSCHIKNKEEVFKFKFANKGFCEACHKNVHNKQFSKKFASKSCASCHTTYDFKKLKDFNHNLTRFKHTGKHKKIEKSCSKCHIKTKKLLPTDPPRAARKFVFNGARKGFCEECHKNIHTKQFHRKFYKKPCTTCHTTNNFTKLKKFNHDTTRFKLTGKHKKIATKCSECHVKSGIILATKPPKRGRKFMFNHFKKGFCTECHKNVHIGQFSKKFSSKPCSECHTTRSFTKRKSFDHNQTGMPIVGKHKKLACKKCHVPTKKLLSKRPKKYKSLFQFKSFVSGNCTTCHEDVHNGDMGQTCSNCHTAHGWDKTPDFHKNFMLSGVHFTLNCQECHVDNRHLGGMSQNCFVCHAKDNRHGDSLQNCEECHSQLFWGITKFRHSLTQFPLRGAHRDESCISCHADGIYQGKPSDCIFCHADDAQTVKDPDHSQAEFIECQDCHNQFNFNIFN